MRTSLQRLEKSYLVKFFLFAFVVSLIFAFLFYFPLFRVVGTLDNSMPQRFYLWIKPSQDPKKKDEQIRKYRFVEAFVEDLDYLPIKKKKVKYFVKEVVCFPKDYLLAKEGKFYCNGKFLGQANPRSPHPPISYDGEIPEGYYFLMGKNPFSFDSRYMGLISIDRITGVLIPIF